MFISILFKTPFLKSLIPFSGALFSERDCSSKRNDWKVFFIYIFKRKIDAMLFNEKFIRKYRWMLLIVLMENMWKILHPLLDFFQWNFWPKILCIFWFNNQLFMYSIVNLWWWFYIRYTACLGHAIKSQILY